MFLSYHMEDSSRNFSHNFLMPVMSVVSFHQTPASQNGDLLSGKKKETLIKWCVKSSSTVNTFTGMAVCIAGVLGETPDHE